MAPAAPAAPAPPTAPTPPTPPTAPTATGAAAGWASLASRRARGRRRRAAREPVTAAAGVALGLALGLGALALALALALAQAAGAAAAAKSKSAGSFSAASFFKQLHAADELLASLDALAASFAGLGARTSVIGKSAEKRALKVLSVGSGERGVFVMGGMHGREWVTPMAVTYAAYDVMAKAQAGDADARRVLEKTTLHFLPLLNPDGFEFSFTKTATSEVARQWRKNRRLLPCKGDKCVHGVDLNRNWGIEGKTFGFGATRATSDVYQGKRPFSEPEIKAVKDWLLEGGRGKTMGAVLDVHCCAAVVLPPSYYHDEPDALRKEHLDMAGRIAKAMTEGSRADGVIYGHRERERDFGPTNSGISVDWLYGESGADLAFIVETRPANRERNKKLDKLFDVDPLLIAPLGAEVALAVKQTAAEVLRRLADAKPAKPVPSGAGASPPLAAAAAVADASAQLQAPVRSKPASDAGLRGSYAAAAASNAAADDDDAARPSPGRASADPSSQLNIAPPQEWDTWEVSEPAAPAAPLQHEREREREREAEGEPLPAPQPEAEPHGAVAAAAPADATAPASASEGAFPDLPPPPPPPPEDVSAEEAPAEPAPANPGRTPDGGSNPAPPDAESGAEAAESGLLPPPPPPPAAELEAAEGAPPPFEAEPAADLRGAEAAGEEREDNTHDEPDTPDEDAESASSSDRFESSPDRATLVRGNESRGRGGAAGAAVAGAGLGGADSDAESGDAGADASRAEQDLKEAEKEVEEEEKMVDEEIEEIMAEVDNPDLGVGVGPRAIPAGAALAEGGAGAGAGAGAGVVPEAGSEGGTLGLEEEEAAVAAAAAALARSLRAKERAGPAGADASGFGGGGGKPGALRGAAAARGEERASWEQLREQRPLAPRDPLRERRSAAGEDGASEEQAWLLSTPAAPSLWLAVPVVLVIVYLLASDRESGGGAARPAREPRLRHVQSQPLHHHSYPAAAGHAMPRVRAARWVLHP